MRELNTTQAAYLLGVSKRRVQAMLTQGLHFKRAEKRLSHTGLTVWFIPEDDVPLFVDIKSADSGDVVAQKTLAACETRKAKLKELFP
jgi:hypothetical protein